MEYEEDEQTWDDRKPSEKIIIFYLLQNKLVVCQWKHPIKPFMLTDDFYFLSTPGIGIRNYRDDSDFACVDDNYFSGLLSDSDYPQVKEGERKNDRLYFKKGDKYKEFYIAGGESFQATHIEVYGVHMK